MFPYFALLNHDLVAHPWPHSGYLSGAYTTPDPLVARLPRSSAILAAVVTENVTDDGWTLHASAVHDVAQNDSH